MPGAAKTAFPAVDRLPETEMDGRLEARIAALSNEIIAFMQHHTGDPHLGADLAQDALAQALRTVKNLREPKALRGWVFRIAINRFNDHLRRSRFEVSENNAEIDRRYGAASPESLALNQELDLLLRKELHALPERQRTVLLLHGVRELSNPEIAQLLGISVDAVKMSLFHAREKMRERLGRYLETVPKKRRLSPRTESGS